MGDRSRRAVLGSVASAFVPAFAGCSYTGSQSVGNGTANKSASPSSPGGDKSAFVAALINAGLRVDGTMMVDGNLSLFYYRDADRHREQVRTVALTFAAYRRVVREGGIISVTTLSSPSERHGVFHIARETAAKYARGELSEEQYVKLVSESYDKI